MNKNSSICPHCGNDIHNRYNYGEIVGATKSGYGRASDEWREKFTKLLEKWQPFLSEEAIKEFKQLLM